MKISNIPSLSIALGSTLLANLTPSTVHAKNDLLSNENPFKSTELSSGYMQLAKLDSKQNTSKKMKDGSCGEGQCGSSMMKGSEEKTAEGQCAGNKPMPANKKSDKDSEGKCGEGKCGSM